MLDTSAPDAPSDGAASTDWLTPELAGHIVSAEGTPTHVLNLHRLDANYLALRNAFDASDLDTTILYSVKTNYMPRLLERLYRLGSGVDVVSGPELELALGVGFPARSIVFNGPHKSDEELENAVRAGVRINLDGVEEGRRLCRLAERLGRNLDVGLRVNPGLPVFLSEDPTFNQISATQARRSKFGFTIEDGAACEAIAAIGFGRNGQPGRLRLTGLHCHLGSQITDNAAFLTALDRVFGFAAMLRSRRHPIAEINIGGGFGVAGIRRERRGPLRQLLALYERDGLTAQAEALDIVALTRGLSERARHHGIAGLNFFCEPGRALISDAMAMVARVSSIKRTGGVDWAILDAGLNLLPTIAMSESHRIRSLRRSTSGASKIFRVGGPLCYEADVLAEACELPVETTVGDLVAIEDSGAYTVSRSTNFIRPRAAVVAVEGRHCELWWRRETVDDIFAFHVPIQGKACMTVSGNGGFDSDECER